MGNTMYILGDDYIDDLFEEEIKEYEEKEKESFCNWVRNKQTYSPAADVEILKTVSAGIYKINNDGQMVKQSVSFDGLYRFKNSEIDTIINDVNTFWERKDIFIKNGFLHKRGILLEGPPGSGKSSVITLLINELIKKYEGVVFLINNVNDFVKIYDFLKGTFRRIEPNRFIITIIEDIDKLVSNSGIEPEVLDFLDGKNSINHHLVITTSNDTSDLSDALLRVSRIDTKYYLGAASKDTREQYFINKGITGDLLEKYVEKSEDLTVSELKELYIGTFILGKNFDEVVDQIINPYEKREFSSKSSNKNKIEID